MCAARFNAAALIFCLLLHPSLVFEASCQEAQKNEQQLERLRGIASLGYLSGYEAAPKKTGVLTPCGPKCQSGVNLIVSNDFAGARLVDLDGEVLHYWAKSFAGVWPDVNVLPSHNKDSWCAATVLPNGELIAIFEYYGIFKVDKDSKVIWQSYNGAHHDLLVLPNGDVVTICSGKRAGFFGKKAGSSGKKAGGKREFQDNCLQRFDRNGRSLSRVSFTDALANSPWSDLLSELTEEDPYHINSLYEVKNTAFIRKTGVSAGSFLVSIRSLNALAVVNMEKVLVEWFWQGPFYAQHSASILKDGNILLFDNINKKKGQLYSDIAILDPGTRSLVMTIDSIGDKRFFSRLAGDVQALANDNLLVSVSARGDVYELSNRTDVLWHYKNPFKDRRGKKIATIRRARRYSFDQLTKFWIQSKSRLP